MEFPKRLLTLTIMAAVAASGAAAKGAGGAHGRAATHADSQHATGLKRAGMVADPMGVSHGLAVATTKAPVVAGGTAVRPPVPTPPTALAPVVTAPVAGLTQAGSVANTNGAANGLAVALTNAPIVAGGSGAPPAGPTTPAVAATMMTAPVAGLTQAGSVADTNGTTNGLTVAIPQAPAVAGGTGPTH